MKGAVLCRTAAGNGGVSFIFLVMGKLLPTLHVALSVLLESSKNNFGGGQTTTTMAIAQLSCKVEPYTQKKTTTELAKNGEPRVRYFDRRTITSGMSS